MRKFIGSAITNPLISGSAIIFAGTFVGNVFNFLFNLFMSRSLSVEDYGTLASLISIILLTALAAESFIPTIVHFAGYYYAREEYDKLRGLIWKTTKIAFITGGALLLIFISFAEQISNFFKIFNNSLVIIVGVSVFLCFVSLINRAVLQAQLYFRYLSFLNFFSALLKLIAGVAFVLFGLGVYGAIGSFIVSLMVLYLLSFIPLLPILKDLKNHADIEISKIFKYGAPAAIALLGLTFFVTSDIILIKHFYPLNEAGYYAGLSLIGRVIFFFTAPIGTVMFPLIVRRNARDEKYSYIFQLSLLLVFTASLTITIFYFLFPEFVIRLFLKREEYLVIKPLVGLFGIYMTIYSVLVIITNFFLSIKKTKVFIPIILGAFFHSFLIWFFHNTFYQVIIISITVTSLLLILLLLYYWKLYGKTFKN